MPGKKERGRTSKRLQGEGQEVAEELQPGGAAGATSVRRRSPELGAEPKKK
ncbi:MAG: hypothetical protein ACOX20_06685 [Limnochordia bacterium]|jgi:hypothetical protein|nr:hypothetical protein [Bacillota bacterium]